MKFLKCFPWHVCAGMLSYGLNDHLGWALLHFILGSWYVFYHLFVVLGINGVM